MRRFTKPESHFRFVQFFFYTPCINNLPSVVYFTCCTNITDSFSHEICQSVIDTFVDPASHKKPTEAQTIIDPPIVVKLTEAQTIIDLAIETQNNSYLPCGGAQ